MKESGSQSGLCASLYRTASESKQSDYLLFWFSMKPILSKQVWKHCLRVKMSLFIFCPVSHQIKKESASEWLKWCWVCLLRCTTMLDPPSLVTNKIILLSGSFHVWNIYIPKTGQRVTYKHSGGSSYLSYKGHECAAAKGCSELWPYWVTESVCPSIIGQKGPFALHLTFSDWFFLP